MKIPHLKFGDAITIDWADTKSELGWRQFNETRKRKPGYVRSLGYVIDSNKDALTITTSIEESGGSLDELAIPTGCIRKLEVLPGDWYVNGPRPEEG